MNDLSSLIAAYRHKHGIEASVSDEAVKNLMRTDGTLSPGELALLEETFGKKGGEEPIGDTIIGMDKGEPEMPGESKGFWVAAGVAALGLATLIGKRFGVNVPQLAKTLGFTAVAGGVLASCTTEENFHSETNLNQDFTGMGEAIAEAIQNAVTDLTAAGNKWNSDLLNALKDIDTKLTTLNDTQKNLAKQVLDEMKAIKAQNKEIGAQHQKLLTDILNAINKVDANNQAKFDKIIALMKEIKADGSAFSEQTAALLDKLLNQVTSNGKIDENGFNKVVEILNKMDGNNNAANQAILDILSNMWSDIVSGQQGAIDVLNKIQETNVAGHKDIQALIEKLYGDSQINATDRNNQILEAINNVAGVVKNLEGAINVSKDAITGAISELSPKLDAILNCLKNGEITQGEALDRLGVVIEELVKNNVLTGTSNEYLKELVDKAYEILGKPEADIKDYSAVLNEILAAIKDVVAGIEDLKIGIGENNGNIIAELKEIKENQKYQSTQLDAYAQQSAEQNQKLVDKGEEILKAIKGININVEGSTVDVDSIVKAIKEHDASLAAQLEALTTALGVKMDANGQDIVDAINGLKTNINAVKDAVENIKNIGNTEGVDLTKTNNLIQTIINLLSEQNDTGANIDLGEITAMLAQTNKMLNEILNKETPDMKVFLDALSDIKDAIKNISVGSGVDLTKTNNLIQSCINLLTDLVDGQSSDATLMSRVTMLGTQLTEAVSGIKAGDTDAVNAKLEKIQEDIQALKG